jgi:hypothetical protein
MAEPENHTLHLLRKMDRDLQEFRGKMLDFRNKVEGDLQEIRDKIDRNYEKHQKRLNGLQLAMQGKSFEDYCAVARFDERISALEKRGVRPRKPKPT